MKSACTCRPPAAKVLLMIVIGAPSRPVATPPASRTSRMPGATSHGETFMCVYRSMRPHAAYASPSAALPVMRMPCTSGKIRSISSSCRDPITSSYPRSILMTDENTSGLSEAAIGSELQNAPPPAIAQKPSPCTASYVRPMTGSPSRQSATFVHQNGKPIA
jgi:hypothetical protein